MVANCNTECKNNLMTRTCVSLYQQIKNGFKRYDTPGTTYCIWFIVNVKVKITWSQCYCAKLQRNCLTCLLHRTVFRVIASVWNHARRVNELNYLVSYLYVRTGLPSSFWITQCDNAIVHCRLRHKNILTNPCSINKSL